jgi:hypothetical protein
MATVCCDREVMIGSSRFVWLSLILTQLVERLEYRGNLPIVLRIWIDVHNSANQRNIFGTQFLPQFVSLLSQFLSFYGVFVLVDLVIEFNRSGFKACRR